MLHGICRTRRKAWAGTRTGGTSTCRRPYVVTHAVAGSSGSSGGNTHRQCRQSTSTPIPDAANSPCHVNRVSLSIATRSLIHHNTDNHVSIIAQRLSSIVEALLLAAPVTIASWSQAALPAGALSQHYGSSRSFASWQVASRSIVVDLVTALLVKALCVPSPQVVLGQEMCEEVAMEMFEAIIGVPTGGAQAIFISCSAGTPCSQSSTAGVDS